MPDIKQELILASMNGDTEKVKEFLAKEEINVNFPWNGDKVPVVVKVRTWFGEGVEEVNFADHYINAALMSAAAKGHAEIVEALLDKGAYRDGDSTIYCGDFEYTILSVAAENGHTEVVNVLLERELQVNRGPFSARAVNSAFFTAVKNGHIKVVNALLTKIPGVIDARKHSKTALICAAENGDKDLVKLLLDKGADVNKECQKGGDPRSGKRTALTAAVWSGRADIVRLLRERGAEICFTNLMLPIFFFIFLLYINVCLACTANPIALPLGLVFMNIIPAAFLIMGINPEATASCISYVFGSSGKSDQEGIITLPNPVSANEANAAAGALGGKPTAAAGAGKDSANSDAAAGESKESSDQSNHKPGHTPTK